MLKHQGREQILELSRKNSIYCTQKTAFTALSSVLAAWCFVRGVPKERRWQRRGEWCQRRGKLCSQSFSQQSQELQPVSGSAGRAGHAPGAAPTPQEKQCPALGHLKSSSSPESHQGYSDTASWTRFAFRFQESTEYFMKMVGSTGIFCHSHCKLKHFPALSKWDYKSGFICLSLGTFCFTLQKKRKKQHISTNSFFFNAQKIKEWVMLSLCRRVFALESFCLSTCILQPFLGGETFFSPILC